MQHILQQFANAGLQIQEVDQLQSQSMPPSINSQQNLNVWKNKKQSHIFSENNNEFDQDNNPMIISNIEHEHQKRRNLGTSLTNQYTKLASVMHQLKDVRQFIKTAICFVQSEIKFLQKWYCENFKDVVKQYQSKMKLITQENITLASKIVQLQGCIKSLNQNLVKELENKSNLQQKINNLELQNQLHQEHIFDIGQKIAGVQLEVELKLKDKIKIIQKEAVLKHKQQKHNEKDIDTEKLSKEFEKLNKRCLQYQQNLAKFYKIQSDLTEREEKLIKTQRKLQNQICLTQIQKKKIRVKVEQLNFTEQNWNKKMSQLKARENEMKRWENELGERQFKLQNSDLLRIKSEQIKDSYDQFSLRSFGNTKNQYRGSSPENLQEIFDDEPFHFHEQFQNHHQPQHQLQHQPEYEPQHRSQKQLQSQLQYENERVYYKKPQKNEMNQDIKDFRKYNNQSNANASTYSKGKDESTNIKKINSKIERASHNRLVNAKTRIEAPQIKKELALSKQILAKDRFNSYKESSHPYNLPSSRVTNNYHRESSQSSRRSGKKSSTSRDFHNQITHQHQSRISHNQSNRSSYSGLGSKLEKLREEIRKEIDSIH